MSTYTETFREKTNYYFQDIDGLSASDIEDDIRADLNDFITTNALDIQLKDIVLYGSRCRGLEKEDSDLDVIVFYESDTWKEDTFFNLLHEEPYFIGEVKVDFNPILAYEHGILEDYLHKADRYLQERERRWEINMNEFYKSLEKYDESGRLHTIFLNPHITIDKGGSNADFDISYWHKHLTYAKTYEEAITIAEELENQEELLGVRELDQEQLDSIINGTNRKLSHQSVDYAVMQFNEDQMQEINAGLQQGLDVSWYANPEFDFSAMSQIRKGLEQKLDVSYYAKTAYSSSQMYEIREGLQQGVDVSLYADANYKPSQMEMIRAGLKAGVDISIYSNPEYNSSQMYQIYDGLVSGLDVSIYADVKFSEHQMRIIKDGLKQGLDATIYADERFNISQMEEIRTGLENGIDASVYAKPNLDFFQMRRIRKLLEEEKEAITKDGLGEDALLKKSRLFIDLDGTLAKFQSVNTMETLYEEGYFLNLEPIQNVIDAVKLVLQQQPELPVYIMSSVLSDSKYALKEKNLWIDKYLPEIRPENRIFPPCGANKLDYVPGEISIYDYLLDDYTQNLNQWEPPAKGIKLLNGINGTKGMWNSNMISYEKESMQIAKDILAVMNGEIVKDMVPLNYDGLHKEEWKDFLEKEEYSNKYRQNLLNAVKKYVNLGYETESIKYLASCEARYIRVDDFEINKNMSLDELKAIVDENIGVISFEELNKMDYVILDTETTGFGNEDEVIELGILDKNGNVLYDNLLKPLDGHVNSEEAQNVNQISNKELQAARSIDMDWEAIKLAIGGRPIVTYNMAFDRRMMIQTAQMHGIPKEESEAIWKNAKCIMQSYVTYKDYFKPVKLQVATEEYGIEYEQVHRAVDDCFMAKQLIEAVTDEVFKELYNSLQTGFETVANAALNDIDNSNSEWGSWIGRVANTKHPKDYLDIDIMGYSTHHEVVCNINVVHDNQVVAMKSVSFHTDMDDFSKSVKMGMNAIISEISEFLKEAVYKLDTDMKHPMRLYAPNSTYGLEEHYEALRGMGYGLFPDTSVASVKEHTSIAFSPSDTVPIPDFAKVGDVFLTTKKKYFLVMEDGSIKEYAKTELDNLLEIREKMNRIGEEVELLFANSEQFNAQVYYDFSPAETNKEKKMDEVFILEGNSYSVLDKWTDGTTSFILGQDNSSDMEWYAVQATETLEGYEGTYTHEYDILPNRDMVENTHVNMLSTMALDRYEAEYGADGRRAFPHLNDEPKEILTFTVAECSEFHSLGAYYENIASLDEAISLYSSIDPSRMHGIPAIGVNIHTEGTESFEDTQMDIFSGKIEDFEILDYFPELKEHPVVQSAVEQLKEHFFKKELEKENLGEKPQRVQRKRRGR